MDIKKLIGETTEYDKKQSVEIRRPKSWLKSVSAFANGDGGYLIFGIADDGTVVGLLDAEKDAEAISERIKARMDPIPEFFLSFEEEEDKTLIILKISKAKGKKHHIIIPGMEHSKHLYVLETKVSKQQQRNRNALL